MLLWLWSNWLIGHYRQKMLDIWLYPLQTLPDYAVNDLSVLEQQRVQRYCFVQHKMRFIAAHRTLRWILGRYLQQPLDSIEFIETQYGKPLLADAALHFNLSHSANYAALAVSSHAVGIDLESFKSRAFLGIARHVYSVNEQRVLAAMPLFLRPLAFFSLWTQKESIIKAIGHGLHYPLSKLDLQIFHTDPVELCEPVCNSLWKINTFMPYVGYSAALCYHPSITNLRYYRIHCLTETLC